MRKGMLRTAGFRCFSKPVFFLGDVRMALVAAKQPQSILAADGS